MLEKEMVAVDARELGKVSRMQSAAARYIEHCKSAIAPQTNFKGLKVALDCANGAAYQVAPKVFQELGATVSIMNNLPNGFNINEQCGSTHIQGLRDFVLEESCDLGIAFDGDADRVLMVDHQGNKVDGDQLLYVLTSTANAKNTLSGGVVGTLMTNLGLEKRLADLNVPFSRANVGDRYVLREMQEQGWTLGGESSGHIICLDKTTTGDGLVSALLVVEAILDRKMSLAAIVSEYEIYPQEMINVKISDSARHSASEICAAPTVQESISKAEETLADTGRILLRPSGTEPLIRVMVEGQDADVVHHCCVQVAESVQSLC